MLSRTLNGRRRHGSCTHYKGRRSALTNVMWWRSTLVSVVGSWRGIANMGAADASRRFSYCSFMVGTLPSRRLAVMSLIGNTSTPPKRLLTVCNRLTYFKLTNFGVVVFGTLFFVIFHYGNARLTCLRLNIFTNAPLTQNVRSYFRLVCTAMQKQIGRCLPLWGRKRSKSVLG